MAEVITAVPSTDGGQKRRPRIPVVNHGHPLARGLLGVWTASEGTGVTTIDRLTGTVGVFDGASSIVWANIQDGRAYDYFTTNGTEANRITVGRQASVAGKSHVSVAFGIQPDSDQSSATVNPAIYYESTSTGGYTRIGFFQNKGTYDLGFYWRDSNTGSAFGATGTAALSQNVFHHVVGTVNSDTNNQLLYVDGIQVASNTTSKGAATSDVPANGPLLGAFFQNSSNSSSYDGKMAYAYVWNRELTPTEVMQLYQDPYCFLWPQTPVAYTIRTVTDRIIEIPLADDATNARKPRLPSVQWGHPLAKGLTGCWSFALGSGTEVREYAGLSTTGTLTNGADWLLVGRRGYGINFDGDNDYIELGTVGTNSPLQLDGQPIAVAFGMLHNVGDGSVRIIDKSDGGAAANGWAVWLDQSSSSLDIALSVDGATPLQSNSSVYSYGTAHDVVVQGNGVTTADSAIYVDGVSVGLATSSTWTIPSASTGARIGTWNHSTAREFKGILTYLYVWNRLLTEVEVVRLSKDPYVFLRPQMPAIGSVVAADPFMVMRL